MDADEEYAMVNCLTKNQLQEIQDYYARDDSGDCEAFAAIHFLVSYFLQKHRLAEAESIHLGLVVLACLPSANTTVNMKMDRCRLTS